MAEGVREEWWNHTSHLLAMIHNANPYHKTDAKPSDFNPTFKPQRTNPDELVKLSILAPLFVQQPRKPQLIGGGTEPVRVNK